MEITPVKRTKLNDEVFQQMRQLLAQGKWQSGERIPGENDLCQLFGVSRITIRQALQQLTSLGLIETRPGKGRYVCQPEIGQLMEQLTPAVYLDADSMRQVNEFREMMDTWSAQQAACRASAEDIARLEENYQAMVCCAREADWQNFAQLDVQFHMYVGDATGNSLIRRTYHILHDVLCSCMVRIVERMGDTALSYHRQLIDAIAAGDAARAERIALRHLENNREFLQ